MQQLKNALMALALAATLAVASHARAYAEPQTRTLYNERGQEVGRSTMRGNTTTHKDAMGREVGRSERRGDGTTNYYDEKGRKIGSSRERR